MASNDSRPASANRLRAAREAAMLTREQLCQICERLADQDPAVHTPVSVSAIRHLEQLPRKPRVRTAATLCAALGKTVEDLFPLGLDTPIKNPQGKTRIPPDRPKGGRPRKPRRLDAPLRPAEADWPDRERGPET